MRGFISAALVGGAVFFGAGCERTTYQDVVRAKASRPEAPTSSQMASDACPTLAAPGTESYERCERQLREGEAIGGSGEEGLMPGGRGVPCTEPIDANDKTMLKLCGIEEK